MISKKIKDLYLPLACCLALALVFFQVPGKCYGFEIDIEVAPSTLNILSQGQVVTVHTGIAYSSVDGGTVSLNEVPISWWKADNQGNFVAKFLMTEVKALADSGGLIVPGENDLKLVGYTTEGAEFTGSQVITVIDVEPTGTGGK